MSKTFRDIVCGGLVCVAALGLAGYASHESASQKKSSQIMTEYIKNDDKDFVNTHKSLGLNTTHNTYDVRLKPRQASFLKNADGQLNELKSMSKQEKHAKKDAKRSIENQYNNIANIDMSNWKHDSKSKQTNDIEQMLEFFSLVEEDEQSSKKGL